MLSDILENLHLAMISRALGQKSTLYFDGLSDFLEANPSRRLMMPKKKEVSPKEALFQSIDRLAQVLPADLLREIAKATGFSERNRKIDSALFFWNLVMGFGPNMEKTLASLKRRLETISDFDLAPASFFDRFNERLVAFLEAVELHLLATQVHSSLPRRVLETFKDVLTFDNTILRLQDSLASLFPGAGMPAAAKISAVLSLACESTKRVSIHAGSKADIKTMRLGSWIKDTLLLFDLGFFKAAMFDRISKFGGHFICRLRKDIDPIIIKNNRECRGRSIELEGKRLSEVLPKLKRNILDLEVEMACSFRKYRGKVRETTIQLRLVGVMNEESGEYHLYLTDLPGDQFAVETIADLYAGRWAVELLFKELKSRYALQVIVSSNPEVVKALIYSALITLTVSRRLFVHYRDLMATRGKVVSRGGWAIFLSENAKDVLRLILRASRIEFSEEQLWDLALDEAFDKTPDRDRLDRVWEC
jgi:putative transposase